MTVAEARQISLQRQLEPLVNCRAAGAAPTEPGTERASSNESAVGFRLKLTSRRAGPAAGVAGTVAHSAAEILVLPNHGTLVRTARRAVAGASRPARVVPTKSLQAGLGAMVAYEPRRGAAENAREMAVAATGVRTGAVAVATAVIPGSPWFL